MALEKIEVEINTTKIIKERVTEAFEEGGGAYMQQSHFYKPETDPFNIEVFWDEEGFGVLQTFNLREDLLERLKDDPGEYASKMPGIIAALRELADEVEAIHKEQLDSEDSQGLSNS